MWLLEAGGDFLQGKTLWLRPGTKHLLGRLQIATKPEENGFICHKLTDKSVSRKHAQITLDPVPDGQSLILDPPKRSAIRIEDSSTIGTLLNNTKIGNGRVVELSSDTTLDRYELRLGNCKQILVITWRPVSLALSH